MKIDPATVLCYFSEASFEQLKHDYNNYFGQEFFFDKEKTEKLVLKTMLLIGHGDKFQVFCLSDDCLHEAAIYDFMKWNDITYDHSKYTR